MLRVRLSYPVSSCNPRLATLSCSCSWLCREGRGPAQCVPVGDLRVRSIGGSGGRGRACGSARPQSRVSVCESVTSLSSKSPRWPSETCPRRKGMGSHSATASSAPAPAPGSWGPGSRERGAAALHAPAQLRRKLCDCVQEGLGTFLIGIFLADLPVFMQFAIFPVLDVTVTGFFSISFIVIFVNGSFSSLPPALYI